MSIASGLLLMLRPLSIAHFHLQAQALVVPRGCHLIGADVNLTVPDIDDQKLLPQTEI